MKINHLGVFVSDLEGTREFFVRFFGASSNEMYHNPRTGLKSYMLSFGGETTLEIMTRPDMTEREKDMFRTGYAHISFSVGSREKVDAITAELAGNGFRILSGPRMTGDGFYESTVLGPEQNQIEITE